MSESEPTTNSDSSRPTVRRMMVTVLLALLPAIVVRSAFFGVGVLIQIGLALAFALGFEMLMLKLRAQPVGRFIGDFSAAVTAVLFALLIPPTASWPIAAIGMAAAIVLAKHFYGGLGRNLFNPAMAGLVAVLICFPRDFHDWLVVREPLLTDAHGGLWLALAFACGGVLLLARKIIPWQTPIATLAAAGVSAGLIALLNPDHDLHFPSPTAAAPWLMTAIFLVTDPVTGCITLRGRLIFGAGVGAIGIAIGHVRGDGYGFAFAILLMNALAPACDRVAQRGISRPAAEQTEPNR